MMSTPLEHMPRNQDVVNIVQKTDRDIDKKYNYCRIMYIVIRITPLVCLYIHECHIPLLLISSMPKKI